MKLTTRFFLILLGIAVLPLFLSVFWNINHYNASVSGYYDLHKNISSLAAYDIEEWFQDVGKAPAMLYGLKQSAPDGKINDAQIGRRAASVNPDIAALSVFSRDGRELFFLQRETERTDRPLVSYQAELIKKVRKSGVVSGGDVLCLNSHAYYPLASPLADGRVAVFHFSMDALLEKINSQQALKTGAVIITDGEGRALPCQKSRAGKPAPDELLRIFRGGRTGRLDAVKIGKTLYSGAYSVVDKLGWAVLSLQTDEELYGRQKTLILVFSLFAAVVFGLTLFVVFLISKRIIKPINDMVAVVKGFLKTQRLDTLIPQEGWPEMKILSGVLNRTMLELQAYRAFQLNQVLDERNKAQALIDTIPDGVLLADDRGAIIYSNQTALNLLGIVKISADVAIPGSIKNEAFLAEFTKLSVSNEKFFRAELQAPLAGATGTVLKDFRIIANQFMLVALKRPGRVIIIRDISHEKELEKAKEDFLHMITHDMRAPLATIHGYVELLMKEIPQPMSPSADKYFKTVFYSSRRLRGMIDDILNITKLERGTMALQLDKVSAGELLARVCGNHEPVAVPKNIKISATQPAAPIMFSGDPALLERVVANLVGNALKFTPSGGSIILSCSETEGELLFSVQDTGPGIPEDKRQMIFEKYSQMDEHKNMGFGLGLAMCKMTVELHKGKIWVESEVGKGSNFLFTVSKKIEQETKPKDKETKA